MSTQEDERIERFTCPLPPSRAEALISFWARIFEEPFDYVAPALAGDERAFNDETIFLTRIGGELAATCRLTVCRAAGSFGLLGEVATDPKFRGRGLAHRLCAQARDDFAARGGKALFLATANPVARRVYESLGWSCLKNAQVMVWLADDLAPPDRTLESLARAIDHLEPPTQRGDPFEIAPATPAMRAPMVRLITRDHPWRLLDANAHIYSTRHALQASCEGLYTRYHAVTRRGGAWLAALQSDARPCGFATALPLESGAANAWRVDAFAEHARNDVWDALVRHAIGAARQNGAASVETIVAQDDNEKRQWLAAEGFADAGPAEPRDVHGAVLTTRRMTRSAR